jgi:hypothetical protein
MKIYCEHGAVTADLRALQREGLIELVHFPYDPQSRARPIAPTATPSDAQWRDLNVSWAELTGTWDDFAGSQYLPEIHRIVGPENRRDTLHVDSAVKTGCVAMITVDRDILDHRNELEALLGLKFFHSTNDKHEFRRFVQDFQRTT